MVNPWPKAEDLRRYYEKYDTTVLSPFSRTVLVDLHASIVAELLKRLPKSDLRFLDFGFGSGAFLRQLARRGISAVGVEFSDQNCLQFKSLAQKDSTPVQIINLLQDPDLQSLRGRFHCITLFQVIEHLRDPLATLKKLSQFQEKGDLLYLECPNEDALFLKLKNLLRHPRLFNRLGFYGSLQPPQHLHGFNRKSMTTLLERAGFRVIEISDYPFRDRVRQLENFEFYPSFRSWLGNPERWKPYFIAKLMIGKFDWLFSRALGAGGGLYAVAVKK